MGWTEETSNCDGSTSSIISNSYCDIPMTVFSSSPYSLSAYDLVIVKFRAQSSYGWSDYSDANTAGATVMTVPGVPSAYAGNIMSSEVTIYWSPPTNIGNSAITAYNLWWGYGNYA